MEVAIVSASWSRHPYQSKDFVGSPLFNRIANEGARFFLFFVPNKNERNASRIDFRKALLHITALPFGNVPDKGEPQVVVSFQVPKWNGYKLTAQRCLSIR